MTTKIEVGSVVRLKSGGPRMTVLEILILQDPAVQTPGQNGDCAICGRYPLLESTDAQVMATMMQAQQLWRSRHDAHIVNPMRVRVGWMREGVCDDAHFPLEALDEVKEDEDTERLHRRIRRIRRHHECGE
jgi:hypothetical protein